MHNFKLLKKNIDTTFIGLEIDQVLEELPQIPNTRGGHFAYIDSNWQKLVSNFTFGRSDYTKQSKNNSSFLYRNKIYEKFPKTIAFLKEIAREEKSYLQRVSFIIIFKGNMPQHIETGRYYKYRNRYHLVVQSKKGSELIEGDNRQIFENGELWWLANKNMHNVYNPSETLSIHLVFDLLPKNHYSFMGRVIHSIYQYFFQKSYDILGKEEFTDLIEKNTKLRNIIFYKYL